METDPQLNHNSGPWDHPPPPPPPSNFGFARDGFHHHHNNHRRIGDLHQFNDPPFAGDFHVGHSKPHFFRKRRFDHNDGASYAKLFVGAITRTVTREEICHLFEEHGNVVEVILLNDKRTGQQQEYCFVKYASIEEAERAIAALHNQFALPGATGPLRVKYAAGERERLGLVHYDSNVSGSGMAHKVYVNGLNKDASQEEILEIFSSYGVVVDVYLMRDQLRQSRGCGFVGFSQRHMSVAAINGLDGTYVMRGCDRALAVRFAEPKKPKIGELRATSNTADVRGSNWPSASHQDNSSAATPESTAIFSPTGNQLQRPASCEMEQPRCQQLFSPFCLSVEQSQTLQVSFQSSCPMDAQQHTPSHFNQTSNGKIEGHHDSQSPQHIRDVVESSSAVLSPDPAPYASCGSVFPEASVDCDWSEHICPDGYKYYFNSVTSESRWEKPEKFYLYEQQLQKQRLHNLSDQEHHPSSTLEAPSYEEGFVQAAEDHKQPSDYEKTQLPIFMWCGTLSRANADGSKCFSR